MILCKFCSAEFLPSNNKQKFCSEECRYKDKLDKKSQGSEYQANRISDNWNNYFKNLLNNKNRKSSLSLQDLQDIFNEQNGLCALSGIELTCKRKLGIKYLTNVSIDRIEAGGPYIKENCRLVCWALNNFRVNTTTEEFIWWCKKVTEYNE